MLDWNTPSIEFYEAMGAKVMPEWRIVRATEADLVTLAGILISDSPHMLPIEKKAGRHG